LRRLAKVYKKTDQASDLNWRATGSSDFITMGNKIITRSQNPEERRKDEKSRMESFKGSTTYGEITVGTMTKILNQLSKISIPIRSVMK